MKLKWLPCLLALCWLSCSDDAPVKPGPTGSAYVPTSPLDTTLSFLSFNMAVGFDAERMISATLTSPRTVVTEGRELYRELLASRPRERMKVLADSVARLAPDVVGLQEVLYLHNRLDADTVDFLSLFLSALDSLHGPAYSTVRQIMNPLTIRVAVADSLGNDSVDLYFYEGNAILYKTGVLSLQYQNSLRFYRGITVAYLASTISILRGAVLARLMTSRGTTVDVYNTHLEIDGLPIDVGSGQAIELMEFINGESADLSAAIAMGDFNDSPGSERIKKLNAERFADTYSAAAPTCCYEILDAGIQAVRKLDYILAKNIVRVAGAGNRLEGTFRWDTLDVRLSDHAAVSAAVTFH